jgi:hypothetical protein
MGFGVMRPSESYAKFLIPTSIPDDFDQMIFGITISTSHVMEQCHFPDFDFVTVTCLICASSGIGL